MLIRLIVLFSCLPPVGAALSDDPDSLEEQADQAYAAKDYAKCAALYVKAIGAGETRPDAPYHAACCFALAGKPDDAFNYLNQAIDGGWHDVEQMNNDADLTRLHIDPRWPDLLQQCRAAHERLVQSMTQPALRDELLARSAEDQKVRTAPKIDPLKMRKVDAANTAWMKKVVDKHGWPGKSMVGTDGAFAAWLLVQHADADPKFQARCLELMKKAYEKKEVRGQDLAYLIDRVLVGQGKKQVYGTQFWTPPLGKLQPRPIEDEAHVDARRSEMGLGPLAEYRKIMGQQPE